MLPSYDQSNSMLAESSRRREERACARNFDLVHPRLRQRLCFKLQVVRSSSTRALARGLPLCATCRLEAGERPSFQNGRGVLDHSADGFAALLSIPPSQETSELLVRARRQRYLHGLLELFSSSSSSTTSSSFSFFFFFLLRSDRGQEEEDY